MKKPQKFTISQLNTLYPDEDACLDSIFKLRYGDISNCPSCGCVPKFYRVSRRKCYACAYCSHQIHPLAGTIFHKSSTPLKLWFHAIYLFASSKNGVSAKELERQLGVTYKTAWRIAHQIRILCQQEGELLSNIVEADETYIGGKRRGKRGRGAAGKTPVIGVVERKGKVVAKTAPNTKAEILIPFITSHVRPKTHMMTDEYASYTSLTTLGFPHGTVQHGARQYVDGENHTNTIEGFWSQVKRSLKGTHHGVSSQHLQKYLDEFVFRYNHRNDEQHLFSVMMQKI